MDSACRPLTGGRAIGIGRERRIPIAIGRGSSRGLNWTKLPISRRKPSCRCARRWPPTSPPKKRRACAEATQAAADRARARLENGFGAVVDALVSGSSGDAACTASGVARITFRAELRRRLRKALARERGGTERADNITGRLMRGTPDRFEALLAEYVLRRGGGGSPSSTGQSQIYSDNVPLTAIPALVRWMVAAEAVVDAQAESAGATPAGTTVTEE